MSTINSTETTPLEQWKHEMRELLAVEGRPITSADDPRYTALVEATGQGSWRYDLERGEDGHRFLGSEYVQYAMPHPPAPLAAPNWAVRQRISDSGGYSHAYIGVCFDSDPLEWGNAHAEVSQGAVIGLDEATADEEESEPYITVYHPQGDIGGTLSEVRDMAGALLMGIAVAEGRSVVELVALLRPFLNSHPNGHREP